LKNKSKKSYVERMDIIYPFLTFEDDLYSEFMIQLMLALEPRFYIEGELIAKELDEC
jgi:hypothetical protein